MRRPLELCVRPFGMQKVNSNTAILYGLFDNGDVPILVVTNLQASAASESLIEISCHSERPVLTLFRAL